MFTYKRLWNGSREEVNKWADEREKVKFTSSSVDELSYREFKLSEKKKKNQNKDLQMRKTTSRVIRET